MPKIGVLFSNLGTPSQATPEGVGRFLDEFLMDKYVIQIPTFLRALLVKGIIVPFRKAKSARNYQKVWLKEGSPLLVETYKAANKLQEKLGDDYKVAVGMRYGEPSFASAREALKDCEKVIFFPQYPQYAASSVETSLDHFFKHFDKNTSTVISPYYDHPEFISSYGKFLKEQGLPKKGEFLLMSFHGLPENHVMKDDPTGNHCLKSPNCCETASAEVMKTCYRAQCFKSAHLIAKELGLKPDQYGLSFQSRLGRQRWLEPSTDSKVAELAQNGTKNLSVMCPGFAVDGLETLEEIVMGTKDYFLSKGGESFRFVPCLNDDDHWIEACARLVRGS